MDVCRGLDRHDPGPARRDDGPLPGPGMVRRRAGRPLGPRRGRRHRTRATGGRWRPPRGCLRRARRRRGDPRLAARRRHLPGVRRPVRRVGWRGAGDARRARGHLRRDARGCPRPAGPRCRPGRHVPVADADLPQPVAPRLRRLGLPGGRAPDGHRRGPLGARRGGPCAWHPGAPRLRRQPRVLVSCRVRARTGRPRGARGPVVPVHELARRVRDVLRRPRPPADRQRRPRRPTAPDRGGPPLVRRRRRRLPVRLRQRPLTRVLERVPRGHARRPAGQRHAGRGRRDPGAPAELRGPARRLSRLPADAGPAPVLRLPRVHGRRARRVPAAAPRVLRRRPRAAVVPGQPRHEPLPVGRGRRRSPAPARRAVPVRPPRSADRVLRHRAGPVAAPGRALRGWERPPRGVQAPDAVGRRGSLAARVLRGARAAAARDRGPVAPAARDRCPRRRARPVRVALRRCCRRRAGRAQQRRWRGGGRGGPVRRMGPRPGSADGVRLAAGRLVLPPVAGAILVRGTPPTIASGARDIEVR